MVEYKKYAALLCASIAALSLTVSAGHAQSFEEIDTLSDIAIDEEAGIKHANDQAERGELLEALATLERVLATFPRSNGARVLHAVYLCDVDDKQGGLVELNQLKVKDIGEEALAAAYARCGQEKSE